MRTIPIDMDYLVFAYQDDSPDNIYYLDTEFGDIRLVNRNLSDLKDLTDEIELSQGRFLYIPKPAREEVLEDLKVFWDNLADAHLKNLLSLAFETPSVAGTFKSILIKYPDELKEFEDFRKERTLVTLMLWLKANALAPAERQGIAP
jgi:Uncharacterised protein family (UPF0158)